MPEPKLCRRCERPVVVNAESHDIFEQMHWLCFHLEFEHDGDPDQACTDPSCPWWRIEALNAKLMEVGLDPKRVITEAMGKRGRLVD